ncbi:ester cyclase [Streptantibioticus rubrisoli]|uniref:Ester cyclase n=1 Tax=Streptantibioticus rubrisoli TaxID=1387313 RepID=A0ABT1PD72_9ACTN|nr:ester cyclase [Streptantibioticus rubrisoli]MCQ4043314.1 ester cyclase [Streptantibioticus rubrisoli]
MGGRLTGWLTDFQVSVGHYAKNIVEPWKDLEMHEDVVVEGADAVTIRFRVEATHIGEFLGVEPTGRRISFDAIRIVKARDGKVTRGWAQLDLRGAHRQLTDGRTRNTERGTRNAGTATGPRREAVGPRPSWGRRSGPTRPRDPSVSSADLQMPHLRWAEEGGVRETSV